MLPVMSRIFAYLAALAGLSLLALVIPLIFARQQTPLPQRVALGDQGGAGIWVYMVDWSGGRHIARYFPVTKPNTSPMHWSPDGRYLLYTAIDPHSAQLIVQTLDTFTGETQTISNTPTHTLATSPRYAPDGRSIAYVNGVRTNQLNSGQTVFRDEIHVVDTVTGENRVLHPTITDRALRQVLWSTDGATLLYLQDTNAGGTEVRTLEVGTGADTRVYSSSPVRLRTVYLTADGRTLLAETNQNNNILDIDLSRGRATVVPRTTTEWVRAIMPAPHNDARLWVLGENGLQLEHSNGTLSTLEPNPTFNAMWSPDGQAVAYLIVAQNDRIGVYMRLLTGERVFVTERLATTLSISPIVAVQWQAWWVGALGVVLVGVGAWRRRTEVRR